MPGTVTPSAPPLVLSPISPPLRTMWPGPGTPAAPVVLGGAGAVGVVAASLVPVDRPGLGWLLAGIAVTVAMLAVRRGQPRPAEPSLARWLWSGTALALLAVGTVRASEWLFALCVVGACAAGSLGLAGGRTAGGVLAALAAGPVAALRGLPWAAHGLAVLRRPANAVRLGRSVTLTVALVVVFGALFAGADAAFAHVLGMVLPTLDASSIVRWMLVFGVAAAVTLGACYLAAAPPDLDIGGTRPKTVRRLEWALPAGVLLALFAAFVLVQLTVLFGGRNYVLRTAGLTAAEYARRGFWQLAAVTVLALVVIAVVAGKAPRATRADRTWLRVVLGGLAGLTLVVVASALVRMWAYQQAYGFTVLRLLVATCELWLGVVYLMVLAAGVRLRAPWLPRAIVGSALATLLGLAVVNPEAYVAGHDVTRYADTGTIDAGYLATLSADAVPDLARLPDPVRSCVLTALRERLSGPDPWSGWNLGRATARDLLDRTYLRPPAADCFPDFR
ncbi:MAG TPA: DUF4173 domain-containing protein [Actinophytocola sp.]|uniref:DUF4153 domain-containing protein n=1 Tax=Actinophytocola sp. TaxID=1872138 RepID=UPI002E029D94|nr:DUF4173 domain-containing protein [Actinophytocola sp.]